MNDLSKYKYIIGCDEVGTGALCGPIVVGAVKAPPDWNLEGLNDSKKFKTDKKREAMRDKLSELINAGVISFHLAKRSNVEVDELGYSAALKGAYVESFHKLHQPESFIIIDGTLKFDNLGVDAYNKQSVIKADGKFPTVMAASILAKCYRDSIMKEHHLAYPQYDWISNVGYSAPKHLAAIAEHGPCPLHRFSYAPMKNMKPTE